MPSKRQFGSSMVPKKTPSRAKRDQNNRKNQEQRWSSLSGPVTTIYLCICPREGCRADTHISHNSD